MSSHNVLYYCWHPCEVNLFYYFIMNYHTFVHLCFLHYFQDSHPLLPHHPRLTFLVESVWRILKHGIAYDAFLTCVPIVPIFPT